MDGLFLGTTADLGDQVLTLPGHAPQPDSRLYRLRRACRWAYRRLLTLYRTRGRG